MASNHAQIKAPNGLQPGCRGWHQQATRRMLINNPDPDVAEEPDEWIVHGSTGVMDQANAGYEEAIDVTDERGGDLPMING